MSTADKDLADIWELTLKIVQPDVKRLSFDTILKNSSLEELNGNTAVVKVQNDFAREWLAARYTDKIEDALRGIVGSYCKVQYTVGDSPQLSEQGEPVAKVRQRSSRPKQEAEMKIEHEAAPKHPKGPLLIGRQLQKRYIFERYHVGAYNDIPVSFINAMLENKSHSPLFIYSSVGMGKTHLLQATARRMLEARPDAKVGYLTSEDFTNELIKSINAASMQAFRDQYRQLDLLLVDDIQFFAGKEKTQEEFFFTFNTITEEGKLVIISSDRHPKELTTLHDRLHSRVKSAQIASISATTYEDRIGIQQKWMNYDGIVLPNFIYEKVASRVTNSIRELEGALTNIITRINIIGKNKVSPEFIDDLLDEISPGSRPQTVTVAFIQKTVAEKFNVNLEDMNSSSRVKAITEARQSAMYICREILNMPLESIGREFGGRNHATVLHACRKVKESMEKDISSKDKIGDLLRDLRRI
ncbi:MAG TPA: chromosomal replication initiator protein DnaA [Bacillota bacterium]|nr:chromosomal replication initiator protein DnaA [Bacillota bacterium]HOH10869.1 chromosomal replication initiator protein DnaA [Bacillota bacterium]HOS49793.1 chromosomal replication initiator protein DnaA [Bacillota bacterium]HOY88342.1 chromosomal replication initiator protein DnaA [Bacillota bacterium]HPI00814.1 chromosomal replication initiator protein DnaA [Bacillota bacterium]